MVKNGFDEAKKWMAKRWEKDFGPAMAPDFADEI